VGGVPLIKLTHLVDTRLTPQFPDLIRWDKMSDIIPPILSSTPPPLADIADDEDDFGDFAVADDPFQTDSEPGKISIFFILPVK